MEMEMKGHVPILLLCAVILGYIMKKMRRRGGGTRLRCMAL